MHKQIISNPMITDYVNRDKALHPYVATETIGMFDTWLRVKGGGYNAQAEAARTAISKALTAQDHNYAASLRRCGYR